MENTVLKSRPGFGPQLKEWRQRRRLSQLDLAAEADISQRHLSFLESGRSRPSRDMILRLADQLSIPLREQNTLLVAAGFAPAYQERAMDHPALDATRHTVEQILKGHEPHPALAIDRHWHLISANRAIFALLDNVDPFLLEPPVNVLRLSLHPNGLAPRISNIREWRHHIFERLKQQIDTTGDTALVELLEELTSLPVPIGASPYTTDTARPYGSIAVPLQLKHSDDILTFISTTTVFGTALDVSLSELAIEAFYPMDNFTATTMRHILEQSND